MAIYTGSDGVVREINHFDIGAEGVVRHAYSWKAGIEGVVRPLNDITDYIDYIAIVPNYVDVAEIDSQGVYVKLIGSGIDIAKQYGNVLISGTTVYVYCYKAASHLSLFSDIYVVFKDGHRQNLYHMALETGAFAFSLSVLTGIYSNTNGWYMTTCLGMPLYSGDVSGSASARKYLSSATSVISQMSVGLKYDGTTYVYQSFESITINGKSYTIKVKSELS